MFSSLFHHMHSFGHSPVFWVRVCYQSDDKSEHSPHRKRALNCCDFPIGRKFFPIRKRSSSPLDAQLFKPRSRVFLELFSSGSFERTYLPERAFQNAVRREDLFDRLQFAPTFLVCVCFLMLYWSALNGELVIEGFFTVGRHVSPSWFAVRPRKRIYGRWLVQDWSFFRRLRF